MNHAALPAGFKPAQITWTLFRAPHSDQQLVSSSGHNCKINSKDQGSAAHTECLCQGFCKIPSQTIGIVVSIQITICESGGKANWHQLPHLHALRFAILFKDPCKFINSKSLLTTEMAENVDTRRELLTNNSQTMTHLCRINPSFSAPRLASRRRARGGSLIYVLRRSYFQLSLISSACHWPYRTQVKKLLGSIPAHWKKLPF